MKTRLAAVGIAASGALILAGCGAANETGPRRGIRFHRWGPRGLRNDLRRWRQHPAGRDPGVGRGFPEDQPGRHDQLRPQRLGRRAHPVHRGRRRLGGQRRVHQGRRGHQGRLPAAAAVSSRCRSTSRRSRSSTTSRASTTCSSRRRRSRRSSPARSPPGTTRPSRPTTRASTCPPPRSPRCTAATSPAPPQNFTDYLSGAAKADWPSPVADTWPIQGGEAAQGTSGVIGAVKGGQGTIGYADESQAKGLGDGQGQGRRRVGRPERRGRRQGRSRPRSA